MADSEVHNLTEDSDIKSTTKIVTKAGSGVELNYTDVQDFIDNSPLIGYINVTDAPYSAVGDGSTDDFQAIQDALAASITLNKKGIYLPGDSSVIYEISDTLVVETLKEIRMDPNGATIRIHSSFDNTETWAQMAARRGLSTPADKPGVNWLSDIKGMLTGGNVGTADIFGLSRTPLTNVTLDCNHVINSSGIAFQIQQPCKLKNVTVKNFNNIGMRISIQQSFFENIRIIGSDVISSEIGLQIDTGSFMYWHRLYIKNCEQCINTTSTSLPNPGAENSFNDVIFDMTTAAANSVCAEMMVHKALYFENVTVLTNSTLTVFHITNDAENPGHHLNLKNINTDDNTGVVKLIHDETAGRVRTLYSGVAGTASDGYQQMIKNIIIPGRASVIWPSPSGSKSVLMNSGKEIMIGGGNDRLADAIKLIAGSDQSGDNILLESTTGSTGNLLVSKDTAGTERYVISSAGLSKPPSYSNATRPSASTVGVSGKVFNTDDNFHNVSDGTNWRDPTGAIT